MKIKIKFKIVDGSHLNIALNCNQSDAILLLIKFSVEDVVCLLTLALVTFLLLFPDRVFIITCYVLDTSLRDFFPKNITSCN